MPEVPEQDEIAEIADPAVRLVHAGARLLVDDGFRVLANGFSPEFVTSRAGRTRRVFYDHFDTKEDYVREVLGAYLDLGDHASLTADFQAAFDELILSAEGDIIDAVDTISAALFPASTVSSEPLVQSVAWGVAVSDDVVRAKLDDYFEAVDHLYEGIVERALDEWGQKLRPPWTPRMLTLVMRAVIDGFYVRNRVRPGTVDHEFFAQCILAMAGPVMQHRHEPDRPFAEELQGLSRQNAARWREKHDPDLQANTRRRVLESVVPALRANPPSKLTLEEIARWADVGEGSLKQVFGSTRDVLLAAITESMPAFEREASFDLTSETIDLRETFRRHLLRLSRWVASNPELAHAALVLPLEERRPDGSSPTLKILTSFAEPAEVILRHGVSTGVVDEDRVTPLAMVVTQTTLGRSVSTPWPEEETIAFLVDMALGERAVGERALGAQALGERALGERALGAHGVEAETP